MVVNRTSSLKVASASYQLIMARIFSLTCQINVGGTSKKEKKQKDGLLNLTMPFVSN